MGGIVIEKSNFFGHLLCFDWTEKSRPKLCSGTWRNFGEKEVGNDCRCQKEKERKEKSFGATVERH